MSLAKQIIGPRKILIILLTLVAVILIPYFGAYFFYDTGTNFPPNYFHFPPDLRSKPSPNSTSNIIGYCIFCLFILFYIFPQIFGFKKSLPLVGPRIHKQSFPKWFWVGLFVFGVALVVLASHQGRPKWLLDWGFIPLCWGFILLLDGIAYKIHNGQSLIKDSPTEIIAMGIISISGWLIFEYFNFFINHNWAYPAANLVDHDQYLLYAALGSSSFIPMSFEWYQLIRNLKVFETKYKQGPKINLNPYIGTILLILSAVGLYLAPAHPDDLFYIIWIAPLVILSVVLIFLGIWTPFRSIKEDGNWSALIIFSLTFLIQGLLLECWNYLSADHVDNVHVITFNPAYWQYCIPFASKNHIFEMPLLGYMGYILFSIHCWLWYIIFVSITGIKSQYTLKAEFTE